MQHARGCKESDVKIQRTKTSDLIGRWGTRGIGGSNPPEDAQRGPNINIIKVVMFIERIDLFSPELVDRL
jgi:hypothetical protein